jgi:predicted amidohydrolase
MEHETLRSRLPREVWIATLTGDGIRGSTCDEITQCALRKMTEFLPQQPDIFCLPETFHYWNVTGKRPSVPEMAAEWEGPIVEAMAAFAGDNRCYVIAPIHTLDKGRCYNAAVVIDREGKRLGEYRKIRATEEEMGYGVTPGNPDPPVFQADFGKIGIQICFDIEWRDGWQKLHEKGVEIAFWPSAFGGGKRVNTLAWQNNYCVVSSTALGTTKICDVTGETVLETGRWNPSGVCAPVNLEKAMVHTWPYVERFAEIQATYGRGIRIYSLHEEEFTVIESCSADVKVAEVLRQYQIKTFERHLLDAQALQEKLRP